MENMIKIKGNARVNMPADMIFVLMELRGENKFYEEVLKESLYRTALAVTYLKEIGFDESEICADEYRIYSVENTRWNAHEEKEITTYKYQRTIEVRLPVEEESKLLDLMKSGFVDRINVELYVKNAKKIGEDLLKEAVADSKKKAEFIADQLGMKLDSTANIEYTFRDENSRSFHKKNIFNIETVGKVDLSKEVELYLKHQMIELEEHVSILWKLTGGR